MGKSFPEITPELAEFFRAQPLFFVASAPLGAEGHVNLSPKGLDSLRILGPQRVVYMDLTGSGNETAAHLAENGRITVMACAFAGPPKIVRFYGRGQVVRPGSAAWDELAGLFPAMLGQRHIIDIAVTRAQSSCGFGVPLMEYQGERDQLTRWAEAKGEAGVAEYQAAHAISIDGLASYPEEPVRG